MGSTIAKQSMKKRRNEDNKWRPRLQEEKKRRQEGG
jgi:abortive infection bacteriophage resistance protein